jgi:hypothetical protein
MRNVMSKMTRVYHKNDITIDKETASKYRLTSPNYQFLYHKNIVTDQNGLKIMSFEPKQEMWWDVKLIFKKKLSIGLCVCEDREVNLYVQGVNIQKVYYDNSHILIRKGQDINLCAAFDTSNMEHISVLLILIVRLDRKD